MTDLEVDKIPRGMGLLLKLRRDLQDKIPVQMLQVFLYVGSHNPCHNLCLEKHLSLSTAAGSRNTDILSTGRPGKESEGLNLIYKDFDPTNRRRQMLSLTPKGKRYLEDIK